jgi:hypothetical protein
LVEEDAEFPGTNEVTVFLLNASNDLGYLPQPVVVAGVADEKIEVE